MEQILIQLGTKGSKSRINHGMKACIKIGTVETYHYFDVINIDRYDIIIGTIFMKQHGIMLDFEKDQVRMRGKNLYTLCESMDKYLQVRRQAMWHSKTLQNKKVTKNETKWLQSSKDAAEKIKKAPDKEPEVNEQRPHKMKVSVVEEEDVERHQKGKGITPLHPVLLDQNNDITINDIERILSKVRKWATLTNGPLCIFLLSHSTYFQGDMLQGYLQGRCMSIEKLMPRDAMASSKNMPNHQN